MSADNEERDRPLVDLVDIETERGLLIDPLSSVHPRFRDLIAHRREEWFTPATWHQLVVEDQAVEIMRVLTELDWSFGHRGSARWPASDSSPNYLSAVRLLKPYRLREDMRAALTAEYPRQWNWEDPVDRILGEFVGFLLSHSVAVTRNRKLMSCLRQKGLAVWDASGRILKRKGKAFSRGPQLKVILFVASNVGSIAAELPSPVRSLLTLGSTAILAVDPMVEPI